MGVTVVSYTHFGYHKDLKSTPTYWSVQRLAQSGLLTRLVVLDVADTYDIDPDLFEVPVPGGKFLPRVFYVGERVLPGKILDARGATIDLFDRMTARTIGDSGTVHAFPSLKRTINAAADSESTLVIYAPTAHPDYVNQVIQEECNRHFPNAKPDRIYQDPAVFDRADYIFTLSAPATRTFVDAGFGRESVYKVGPLGVDTDRYEPGFEAERFTVLSVGNMKALKGTIYLLEAWDRLELTDARLVLCGIMSDTVREVLESRIAAMETVNHVGYVEDPAPYYRDASVFVHPSLTEGFGKVVAEAMASGLPVVITENGPTDYVDDAGFVVPIRDPEALADRIEYLHEHPRERRTIGRRARKIAESNTWRTFSERIKQAHETVLEREDRNV